MNFDLVGIFETKPNVEDGVYILSNDSQHENQAQTNKIFSEKWKVFDKEELMNQEKLFNYQKEWYLDLYGFSNEQELQDYLKSKSIILDAGCGLGYKAKWFAELSPESVVLGMDYSNSVFYAQKRYEHLENLIFIKGDIAQTNIKSDVIDYVSCDQVIHHTEDPFQTIKELTKILKKKSELAVYVYAKKALPRELLDEYFRKRTKNISNDEMWKLSEQLTELGKRLSELDVTFDAPEIPLMGIKGGKIDIQRFIYWNFLKCFWNEELGLETSIATNFDWYAPSNAQRYTKDEFLSMIKKSQLNVTFFHSEEACYSGRFKKK